MSDQFPELRNDLVIRAAKGIILMCASAVLANIGIVGEKVERAPCWVMVSFEP